MEKNLKKFGISVGGLIIILVIFFAVIKSSINLEFLSIGLIILGIGIFKPNYLNLLYSIWMHVAKVLGFMMTKIILTLVFIFLVIPIGLVARLFGKKFLDLSWNKNKETYWHFRSTKINKEYYERQF